MPSSLGVKGGGGIHGCVVQLLRLQMGWGSDGEMLLWGGPAGTQQGWSGVQTQSSDPSVVQDDPLGSHYPGRELVLVLSSGRSHVDGQEAHAEPGLPWSPVTLALHLPGTRCPPEPPVSPPPRGCTLIMAGGGW